MKKSKPDDKAGGALFSRGDIRRALLRWAPFFAIGAVCAAAVWLLAGNTPPFADDMMSGYVFQGWYVDKITAPKVTGLGDIFHSLVAYYQIFRGRVIAQGFVQLFVLAGKGYYNFFNALVWAGINYMVYFHANFGKKPSWRLFLLIAVVFWFLTPDFVSTVLWMSGSLCVMWPVFFVLLFLVPYRRLAAGSAPARRCAALTMAMVPLGLVAGAFNEHSFGLSLGFSVLAVLSEWIRKRKVPFWAFAGILSTAAGTAFVLLSPGSRLESLRQYGMSPARLFLDRFPGNLFDAVRMSFKVTKWLLPFLAVLLLWLVIDSRRQEEAARRTKKRKSAQTRQKWTIASFFNDRFGLLAPAMFFACAAAAVLISAALPYVGERLFFPVFVAVALVLFSLLSQAADSRRGRAAKPAAADAANWRKALPTLLALALCLVALLDYGREYSIYHRYFLVYSEAVDSIVREIDAGEKDIVVPRNEINAKITKNGRLLNFVNYWTVTGVGSDPQSMENKWIAYALGADTIRSGS